MNVKQNLHTHTTYCDGDNTPEELVCEAIKLGFSGIGFSGHSYTDFAPEDSMTVQGTDLYIKHINKLKKAYAEQIDIFLGLEVDYYSSVDLSSYDYLIGSVHYLYMNEKYICADGTISDVKAVIDKYFNGNGLNYARKYYETLSLLPNHGKIDIIGHFDLITKHLERESLFDTQTKEYQNIVINTLEALSGKIPFFEVNTGAIANGFRTTPYPSLFVLKQLKRLGYGAIISSDCHDCTLLDYGFDKAKEWLKIAGFNEYYILTSNGFVPIKI